MHSRAKILGHPIHQILIVFPLGLLATAVIFDIIDLVSDNRRWTEIAYWMIYAGIIGGLAAAVFGLIDWLAIPGNTRAKSVGAIHGLANVLVVGLFIGSCLLRHDAPAEPPTLALGLSFIGFAIAGVAGWLGGKLVTRLGVGVDEGANLNAPNSITHKSVTNVPREELNDRTTTTRHAA
jgi:uncharacterized membrane protein